VEGRRDLNAEQLPLSLGSLILEAEPALVLGFTTIGSVFSVLVENESLTCFTSPCFRVNFLHLRPQTVRQDLGDMGAACFATSSFTDMEVRAVGHILGFTVLTSPLLTPELASPLPLSSSLYETPAQMTEIGTVPMTVSCWAASNRPPWDILSPGHR